MKKIIIANWKMNLSLSDSVVLAKKYKQISCGKNDLVVCPDFCSLPAVSLAFKGSKIFLGAQDSAAFDRGAHTGEVSPINLRSLGVKYVIIGHSERREQLHENATLINEKIKAALKAKLIPVLCVGEKLVEKINGDTQTYLFQELRRALKDVKIKAANDLIVAYEPIWAISTNKNAKPMLPEEANEIHLFIKKTVQKILKIKVKVLYGGSVKSDNSARFLQQDNIDGLLVGAASLQVDGLAIIATGKSKK